MEMLELRAKFPWTLFINTHQALRQIMDWRPPSYKPLSKEMMVRLPTHTCNTRPQLVNKKFISKLNLYNSIKLVSHIQRGAVAYRNDQFGTFPNGNDIIIMVSVNVLNMYFINTKICMSACRLLRQVITKYSTFVSAELVCPYMYNIICITGRVMRSTIPMKCSLLIRQAIFHRIYNKVVVCTTADIVLLTQWTFKIIGTICD